MTCSHTRTNVSSKSGPARMATTQDAFRKAFARRFRNLRGAVRKTIEENDALKLGKSEPTNPRDIVNEPPIEPEEQFAFTTDDKRLQSFAEWWNNAVDEGLVDRKDIEAVADGQHWSSVHIDNAYERGIEWSDARLRETGIGNPGNVVASIQLPTHQETLRVAYSRTFNEIQSLGEEAKTVARREIANGLAAGDNPREMASRINDEVRSVQIADARRVARTEVMNAHVSASTTQYERFGVTRANIVTYEPCERCEAIRDAGPYDLEEITGVLPVHPNCVCAIVPVKGDVTQGSAPRGTVGPAN